VHGVIFFGRRHDVSNPLDWIRTNLHFAAHDDAARGAIGPALREPIN
jgi:hypothetical protein